MHVSDEFKEEQSDEEFEIHEEENGDEPRNKRKGSLHQTGTFKKIKYEEITSKVKKNKGQIYKPPTVEELNELKETQNLYNNNLFRLQIGELLKKVIIKNKRQNIVTEWLKSFKLMLRNLPEYSIALSDVKTTEKKKQSEKDKFLNDVADNLEIKSDQDLTVALVKPEDVEIFGLNDINALPGPNLTVNINLKMPRNCFNVRDYLNNRYFVKRYCFLSYIFFHLKKDKNEVSWTYYNNNQQIPILQVTLEGKIIVNIFATPTEDYFKISRCAADMNNVKVNIFTDKPINTSPTLWYNASLAHDMTLSKNNAFIKTTLNGLPNVQEAIKLIYIWIAQKELHSFSQELILYFLTYLVVRKIVNKHMSSYQVVRNFWNFVSGSDLSKNGISLCQDVNSEVLETFQQNFDVTFLDITGYYNVTAFINIDIYQKIKTESGKAFKSLDDDSLDSFHTLFISKTPSELQFDLILKMKSKNSFRKIKNKMSEDDQTKYLGHNELFAYKFIGNILKKGLSKRASLIVPILKPKNNFNNITFGINLEQSEAFHILEKGPDLTDPKEKEFKEFWGELSTDRRFKDGSVNVAVYFKTQTTKDRRDIINIIIDWIMKKHLKFPYKMFYNEMESILMKKNLNTPYPTGTMEEASVKIISVSDDLNEKLRALSMPLAITGVQGISCCFAATDPSPPIACNYENDSKFTSVLENNIIMNEKMGFAPRFVKSIKCVLQLEHSTKWPRDLPTLQHMKTAIYLEISKQLLKKHNVVSQLQNDSLTVLYKGLIFRLLLYIPREIGLHKKELSVHGATTYRATPSSRALERQLVLLPKVGGALRGLQAQYPSFGPTSSLVKRWMRAQMIDHHLFPDEVIDLLVAFLFLTGRGSVTPQGGFLRFLLFLKEFQWQIQAVVVNFNEEITKETLAEIDSKLLQNRDALPSLYLAIPYDDCESTLTKVAPCKEVLNRVKQLATETCSYYLKMVHEEATVPIRSLFVPNLEGYDVLIYIRALLNPLRHEQVVGSDDESEEKNVLSEFDEKECRKIPIVDFNPVQCFLKELRANYGDLAEFFHDSYGGEVIGVLWKPKALEARDFKVSHVNGRKLENGKMVLNVETLLEDFFVLGKGIVKSIDEK